MAGAVRESLGGTAALPFLTSDNFGRLNAPDDVSKESRLACGDIPLYAHAHALRLLADVSDDELCR